MSNRQTSEPSPSQGERMNPDREDRASAHQFPPVLVPPLNVSISQKIQNYLPADEVDHKAPGPPVEAIEKPSEPAPGFVCPTPRKLVPPTVQDAPPPPADHSPNNYVNPTLPSVAVPTPGASLNSVQDVPPPPPTDILPGNYVTPTPTPLAPPVEESKPIAKKVPVTEPIPPSRLPPDFVPARSGIRPKTHRERLLLETEGGEEFWDSISSSVIDPSDRWGGKFVRFSQQGILFCRDDRIVYHNQACLAALGLETGSLKAHSLYDLFPFLKRKEYIQLFAPFFRGELTSIKTRISLLTNEGEKSFLVSANRLSPGRKGSPVVAFCIEPESSFFNVGNDPAQTWNTADLIDRLPVFFWVTDYDSRLVKMNQATLDFFGVIHEPLPFSTTMLVEFHNLETEPNTISEAGILSEFENAKGLKRKVLLNRIPWTDEFGEEHGWIYTAQDVTVLLNR